MSELHCPPTDWDALARAWGEDWHAVWSERAAILEYDAGMPRIDAERLAFVQVGKRRRQGDTP